MRRNTKATWVRKLVQTKHFIILTDTEAVISLKGTDPNKFDDLLMVTAQAAELKSFRKGLDKLIADHDKIARKLLNRSQKGSKNARKKTTKIPVRQG